MRPDVPFENMSADILSARHAARLAGLKGPRQGHEIIGALVGAGLLWRSPCVRKLKGKPRPCFQYRPTYAGLALAQDVHT